MIRIENLTKKFGSFTAVNNVSLEIMKGEVYAFLGPNGSGKTTTLKSIMGLVVPTSGRIFVDGVEIRDNLTETKRLFSYLPQRIVFPDNLTAREIIRFYAKIRKLDESKVDEALALSGFNGFTNKFVNEFSGGMIQRLGLTIIAMSDAPIIILDEPTVNLDPHGVKRFREFIREQKRKRKTIIFSTHLLSEVEQIADHVGIFLGGKLIAEEAIDNLNKNYLKSGCMMEELYLHYVGENHD